VYADCVCSVTMHDRVQQQQQAVPPPPGAEPSSHHPHHHHHHHHQPGRDANNRRHRNSRTGAPGAPPGAPGDHHRRRRDVTSAGINGTGSPALLLASPNSSTSSLNSDVDRQVTPGVVAPDPLSSSPLVRYVYSLVHARRCTATLGWLENWRQRRRTEIGRLVGVLEYR